MIKHAVYLLALFVCASAFAILPASKRDILCNSTYIVVGVAMPSVDFSIVRVKITEVLGVRNSVNRFPVDPGIDLGNTVALKRPDIYDDPAKLITVGSDYIFSISVFYGDVTNYDGTRNAPEVIKNYMSPPPYYTRAWPLTDIKWVVQQLASADGVRCPKAVSK
jgi:hypothetical protein